METTWISTEVELPPEGQAVLVWDGGLHIAKLTRGIKLKTKDKTGAECALSILLIALAGGTAP